MNFKLNTRTIFHGKNTEYSILGPKSSKLLR